MWINFIRNISEEYGLSEPVTKKELDHLEQELQVKLCDELTSLLLKTNGVNDQYNCPFIWSTSQIKEENLNLRNYEDFKDLYMPFDSLLFIANASNGDLFGYSILNGAIQKNDIFIWNHEDDSRTWVAPSLKIFIERLH